jgi:2-polyprenyl-6-methoxyphenol hydroxylase-like FAD-dependent oxidoreductase
MRASRVAEMRDNRYRVLVVGAGIAGLAAARALRAWGATVEIVERAGVPGADGAGIYLPGNASRALDALGLRAPVVAASVPIQRQRFLNHRGRVLADIDVADVWRGVGPCLSLGRATLHEVLLDGARGVPIRWGCTPAAIAADEVGFSDGTTRRYDLVIGADGVHSSVRRMIFGTPARPVGQHARRFVVDRPDAAPTWSARLGPGTVFLTIPIGDGRLYCYCDGPAADSPPPLRELLDGYAEPVPSLLDALEATGDRAGLHSGPVEEVTLPSWSRGRVVLIGDAAHATSPNMAEGGAMALEDAIALADSLRDAATTTDALRRYEIRRRPRTDWVLTHTHIRDRTRTLPPALRNLVLRLAGQRMFRSHYRLLRDEP